MKVCAKCGKKLADEAKFCGGCGTKVAPTANGEVSNRGDAVKAHPTKEKERTVKSPVETAKPKESGVQQQKPEAKQTEKAHVPEKQTTKVVEEGGETMYYDRRPEFSEKKRAIFFLVGLLGGFLGLHFLYARRTFLFLLTLLSLVVFVVYAVKGQQLITLLSALTMAVLWLGGTLFAKKDGSNLPMKWLGCSKTRK